MEIDEETVDWASMLPSWQNYLAKKRGELKRIQDEVSGIEAIVAKALAKAQQAGGAK